MSAGEHSEDEDDEEEGEEEYLGLPSASFGLLSEFIESIGNGSVEEDDRSVHESHPLTLLVESCIESFSTVELGRRIVGVTKKSMKRFNEARRKLERKSQASETQALLFAFLGVMDNLRESSYGMRDAEIDRAFFESLFPEWLGAVVSFAHERGHQELEDLVADLLDEYHTIAVDIVSDFRDWW